MICTEQEISLFDNSVSAFNDFFNITDDTKYQKVLELTEKLDRTINSPLDPRIYIVDALTNALTKYENTLIDISFDDHVSDTEISTTVLRVLMDQHKLKNKDLEFLGGESLVSMLANGKRKLTKLHIDKLSAHFRVNPILFF